MDPKFEYRETTNTKKNDHPFYGIATTKINSDKSRYEEYITFLVLNPLHDYKSSFKINPRSFIISQYIYTKDVNLVDKNGIAIKETYNSYLFKIVVMGLLCSNMTHMKDLMEYKIPFDESKYPDLTKLIRMSVYASFLSVLTEQSQIDFNIYKTNSLDDIILISKEKNVFLYNMKKNVILYDHINDIWYYQMNGTKCYKTKDFFTMFDDLLDLLKKKRKKGGTKRLIDIGILHCV